MRTGIPALIETGIVAELQRQDERWGGIEHDKEHSRRDWVAFICREAGKASADGLRHSQFRKQMIQVAALAISAISADEQKVLAGFYPDEDSYPTYRGSVGPGVRS